MHDNMLIPTADLPGAYRRGEVVGAWLDSDNLPGHIRKAARYAKDEFKREMPAPFFSTAPKKNWKGDHWKGKRAFLWKAWSQLDQTMALKGAQSTGDCVSWGERCKQDIRRCVEIALLGEREQYVKRQATCLLYSGRGHTGQGASPSGIANWALKCGILLEQPLVDSAGKNWDFTSYADYVRIGMQYGRGGMPKAVIDITSKNRVAGQSLIKSTNELFDLMLNGYAASVGFSLDTAPSGNPVSRLSGRTAHQTCMVGFDDTELGRAMVKKSLGYEDTAVFYDQSWGNWNRVTDIPEEWQPWGEGMYVHSARDAQRHINEGECIACSGSVIGFVGSPIDNLLV
jgi:hypothetical protein